MKKRIFHSLTFRISLISLLLVFLPAGGLLFLDTYETQLLKDQEKSMVVLGRALSAALSNRPGQSSGLNAETAKALVSRMEGRHEARVRILDHGGTVLADSAVLHTNVASAPLTNDRTRSDYSITPTPAANESWIYQLGALPVRFVRWVLGAPEYPSEEDVYKTSQILAGSEIQKALEGRYGAATRRTPGQVSVTLYSALPILGPENKPVGVVLVTQSTYRILRDLYSLRTDIFKVVLWSLGAALGIALILSLTLTGPLKRLSRRAGELTDHRGRLAGIFEPLKQKDEIGDLSRALHQLTLRLNKHLTFMESFSQDMAHELKNPLASVRSAAENLEGEPSADQKKRFFSLIGQDLKRMETLIDGIREISRLDAVADQESEQSVDLVPGVKQVVNEVRERTGVNFEVKIPDGEVRFTLAAHRWLQVVENLLDNAAGFAPAGTTVEVILDPYGPILSVRDRGPGVPKEDREKVFNRFFSSRSGAEKVHHAGLGLAIVKSLVEGWGGTVRVEDGDPGALFVVDLGGRK